jgi:hypothetical protein
MTTPAIFQEYEDTNTGLFAAPYLELPELSLI